MCLDCADTQDAMVKAHKSKFREEFPLGKFCESRLANFLWYLLKLDVLCARVCLTALHGCQSGERPRPRV